MFVILEDVRNGVEFAPQSWVKLDPNGGEIIYWPKNNVTKLQFESGSEPVTEGPNKWHIVQDVVKRRNIPTAEAAQNIVQQMIQNPSTDTDSDANIITRTCAKKRVVRQAHVSIPQYDSMKKNTLKSVLKGINIISTNSPTSSAHTTPTNSPRTVATNKTPLFPLTPPSSRAYNSVKIMNSSLQSPLLSDQDAADQLAADQSAEPQTIETTITDFPIDSMIPTEIVPSVIGKSHAFVDQDGNKSIIYELEDGMENLSFASFAKANPSRDGSRTRNRGSIVNAFNQNIEIL